MNYSECEEEFLIYSGITIEGVHPKSGSVKGGAELKFKVNNLQDIGEDLSHLLVGFYPAPKKVRGAAKTEFMQSSTTKN